MIKTTNEYRSSTPSLLVLILLQMSTVKKIWVMRKGYEGTVSQCQESFTRGGVIVERLWVLQGSFRSLWQGLNEACHRVPGKKKKGPLSVKSQFTHRTLEESQKAMSWTFRTRIPVPTAERVRSSVGAEPHMHVIPSRTGHPGVR